MTRLIDAEALKEKAETVTLWNGEVRRFVSYETIDNAPTVEPFEPDYVGAERLKARQRGYAEGYHNGMEIGKTLNPKIKQGEWIPVSERLPEQGNQSYLVTVDYGEGLVCSCQRFFFNEDIGWNDDCVIAWQPLPEPYQKGGA